MLHLLILLLGSGTAWAGDADSDSDPDEASDADAAAAIVGMNDPPPPATARYDLGRGLQIDFDQGKHRVAITGFVQPSVQLVRTGVEEGSDAEPKTDSIWTARHAQIALNADFDDNRYSFELRTDFSLAAPLLSAGARYRPHETITISAGQLQTPTNNREMLLVEGDLALPERGAVSTVFSDTGRELGLFVDGDFALGSFLVRPRFAMTSGDGRNSFGADSRDVDLGGLKWGGRLDLLPLGDFSEGNRDSIVDVVGETKPKLVIGGAFSFNDGASGATGEGHGDFVIYNGEGDPQLPDYFQLYADALLKVRGFSLLVEFAQTSAASLQGTFSDPVGGNPLYSGQISEFLALGQGIGVQVGYFAQPGVSFDLRYSLHLPEFADNDASVVQRENVLAGGVTIYVHDPGARIQLAGTWVSRDGPDTVGGEVATVVRF